MPNHSYRNFKENLEELLKDKSYSELSVYLGVPSSTLKSWINGSRCPTLRNVDKLANRIGCYSSDLLNSKAHIIDKNVHLNDSHLSFIKNLNIIFLKNQCFSTPQKLALLNNVVTDFALQSYLRKQDYKLPTLSKLDVIADALGISTYSLLLEEKNEKRDYT